MNLLSIDPGKRSLAWALWIGGDLWAADIERHKAKAWESKIPWLVDQVDVKTQVRFQVGLGHLVLVERPRIYPYERRVKPEDLLDLTMVAGACAALGPFDCCFPADWKGQTPKKISNARSEAALTPEERARVGTGDHNVWDAVGIGLWYLKKEGIRT